LAGFAPGARIGLTADVAGALAEDVPRAVPLPDVPLLVEEPSDIDAALLAAAALAADAAAVRALAQLARLRASSFAVAAAGAPREAAFEPLPGGAGGGVASDPLPDGAGVAASFAVLAAPGLAGAAGLAEPEGAVFDFEPLFLPAGRCAAASLVAA